MRYNSSRVISISRKSSLLVFYFTTLLCLYLYFGLKIPAASSEVLKDSYVAAAEKVKPSVVSFTVSVPVNEVGEMDSVLEYWLGKNGLRWFKDAWYHIVKKTDLPGPRFISRTGAGLVIGANGLIVTNEHLIVGAQQIVAQLADGRKLPATVVVSDWMFDLAIVSVPVSGLRIVPFGDSSRVEVGQEVLIMGNALGFANSVSRGIISGKGRYVRDEIGRVYENVFQTDAAMNFGDSGGPLINIDGDVIGINLAVVSDGQNISFAMPINDCRKYAQELLSHGKIRRGWIGLKVRADKSADKTPVLLIDGWQTNSPAAFAGFQKDDVVLRINDRVFVGEQEFYKFIREQIPGKKIRIALERKNVFIDKQVAVANFPEYFFKPVPSATEIQGGLFDRLIPETRWIVLVITLLYLWLLHPVRYLRKLLTKLFAKPSRRYGERRKGERRKGERRKASVASLHFPPSLDRRKGERRQSERRARRNRRVIDGAARGT